MGHYGCLMMMTPLIRLFLPDLSRFRISSDGFLPSHTTLPLGRFLYIIISETALMFSVSCLTFRCSYHLYLLLLIPSLSVPLSLLQYLILCFDVPVSPRPLTIASSSSLLLPYASQIAKLHWPNDGSHWLQLALACQQWANQSTNQSITFLRINDIHKIITRKLYNTNTPQCGV